MNCNFAKKDSNFEHFTKSKKTEHHSQNSKQLKQTLTTGDRQTMVYIYYSRQGKLTHTHLGLSIFLNRVVDPDPYWESGSGSKGKKTKKFQWKNALFSYL
jgi:hypothetical protein